MKMSRLSVLCQCLLISCFVGVRVLVLGEVTMDTPLGLTVEGHVVVDKGSEFTLTCRGDGDISWDYNDYTAHPGEESSLKQQENRNVFGEFTSTLTVSNAYFMDTGYFYCFPSAETKNSPWAKSVYVFVRDPEYPLAVNDTFMLVTAHQYETVTIPCRPTDPDITVTLMKDNEEVIDATFDPHIGFTFKVHQVQHSGPYECYINDEPVATYDLHVIMKPQSGYVERPHIEVTPNTYVKGQNVTLRCSVHYSFGTYLNLNWTVPDPKLMQSGRAEVKSAMTKDDKGQQTEVTLLIRRVRPQDQGEYSCSVVDSSYNEKHNSYHLKLTEGNALKLKLRGEKPESPGEIVVEPGKPSVNLVVDIESHPPATRVQWYNNHNELIVGDASDTFVVNTTKSKSETKLTINKPSVFLSGVYRLLVANPAHEQDINIKVKVQGLPELRINQGREEDYFKGGREHRVDCEVMGHPSPNVTWYSTPCDNYPSCEGVPTMIPRERYSEMEDSVMCVLNSSVRVWSHRTLLLMCQACNSVGCSNTTFNFLASDVEGGFALEGPDMVVETDNITLSCAASKYTYSDRLEWLYAGQSPITDLRIWSEESKHSHWTKVNIPSAHKNHSRVYTCRASFLHKRHETREQNYSMLVLSLEKPLIQQRGVKSRVRTGTKVEWQCPVEGTPPPTVIWYKNGQEVAVTHRLNALLHEHNRTLELQVGLEDDGVYHCVAENKAGRDTATFTLELLDKPNMLLVFFFMYILPVLVVVAAVVALLYARRTYKLRKEIKELKAAGLLNFEEGKVECLNPDLDVGEQADLLPYDRDKWEFPRDKLKLGKQLGSGAFGVVMKAEAYELEEPGVATTVAVKMVKRNCDVNTIKALASELKIMIHLGKHLNVVNVLGACTGSLNKRELLVLVEYCQYGNLHNYLLKHRGAFINQVNPKTGQFDPVLIHPVTPSTKYSDSPFGNSEMSNGKVSARTSAAFSQATDTTLVMSDMSEQVTNDLYKQETPLDDDGYLMQRKHEWRNSDRGDYKSGLRPIYTQDLICWGFQIARGMEYLASRKVLHGDLAARNVLLAEDNIVKICDFGLSKSIYREADYRKKGDDPLPVKWMALESIRDRVFSTQSDVWAYGVTLWELFSLACTPYYGMEADKRLFTKLAQGYRMEQPKYATNQVYKVMMDCWHKNPHSRPSFVELTERMGGMLEDTVRTHYVDLNDPFIEDNNTFLAQQDYLGMLRSPMYSNWSPENNYYTPMSPSRPKGRDGEEAFELTPMLAKAGVSDADSVPNSPTSTQPPKDEEAIPDSPDGSPIAKPRGNNYMNMVQFMGFSNPSYQNVNRPRRTPYMNMPHSASGER